MRVSIIFLLAVSFACSKKQDVAPAETKSPAPAEAADIIADPTAGTGFNFEDLPPLPPELGGETPKLGTPPAVIVLEEGDEPRQKLRWAVKPGLEQKVTTELGLAVDALIVLIRTSSPMTATSYDMTLQAKGADKDGTVRVAFSVDSAHPVLPAGAKPMQTEAQERATQQRTNVVGSYTLSPRGAIADLELTTTDGAPANPRLVDALRWSLVQMIPALPAEPVGPGAKWTVHESIIQGGIHVNQLRTIELVKLDGKRMELSMEVRQSATAQPYTNPLTGAKFELETLSGIARGSVALDLGKLAPLTANIDATSLDVAVYRDATQKRKASVVVETERSIKVGGT